MKKMLSALLLLTLLISPSAFAFKGTFNQAIEYVIMNSKNKRVVNLPIEKKRKLVACGQKVFAAMPAEKKKYILAARDLADLEKRAERILTENRNQWKNKFTISCARFAL